MDIDVRAHINDNCDDQDIHTRVGGQNVSCAWAFLMYTKCRGVKDDSQASSENTRGVAIEVLAITIAMGWLDTQICTNACILIISLNMTDINWVADSPAASECQTMDPS